MATSARTPAELQARRDVLYASRLRRMGGCVSVMRSIVVSLCGRTANEAPSARETA